MVRAGPNSDPRWRSGQYRDLRVSPQHRMLVGDWRSEMYFGKHRFCAINIDQRYRSMPCDEITYVHMSFDQHEVVPRRPSESLHLGSMTMSTGSRIPS
jgi:hypothetical protein